MYKGYYSAVGEGGKTIGVRSSNRPRAMTSLAVLIPVSCDGSAEEIRIRRSSTPPGEGQRILGKRCAARFHPHLNAGGDGARLHCFDGEQRVIAEDDLYAAMPGLGKGRPLLVARGFIENLRKMPDCGSAVRDIANVVGHLYCLVRVGSSETERRVRRARIERVEADGDGGFSDQGICERCGALTSELASFNGQLLCADCRDV